MGFFNFTSFVLISYLALMSIIKIVKGDITKIPVDVIVNAANSSLLGGGGVDGAIHRAGGSAILEACQQIRNKQGTCKTGEAVITTAGNLPAKFVIHTVGPVWSGNNPEEKDQLLSNCYQNTLALAVENEATSIAFPNISTGIYAFPKKRAAMIAYRTCKTYLKDSRSIKELLFVCFDEENYSLYQGLNI